MRTQTEPGSKVLEQRCLAIARVPAQDNEPYASLSDIAEDGFLKLSFHISLGRKLCVKPPGFLIPPSRARIGLQEGERSIISEELLLESFTALLSLSFVSREKESGGLDKDSIDDERLKAILETAVTVNHEVNSPLTAILGNIQLLLMRKEELRKNVIEHSSQQFS